MNTAIEEFVADRERSARRRQRTLVRLMVGVLLLGGLSYLIDGAARYVVLGALCVLLLVLISGYVTTAAIAEHRRAEHLRYLAERKRDEGEVTPP